VRFEMASGVIMYISSLMKIGTCVQIILRFCLKNLKSYDVGITDGGIYEVRC
jgi:hypothetical protein